MEKCYITSTRTTHKNRKNEIIGTCGPCSFINLVGLKGSFELEKQLAEMGRMKPFYASNFTSFLIWGEHFNKEIMVYTQNVNISDGTFEMMFKYEKIPKEKQEGLKNKCLKRHSQIILRNKSRIKIIEDTPLKIIDYLLDEGHSLIFSMADYFGGNFLVSHYKVCYGKKNNEYLIKDSGFGDVEGVYKITKGRMERELHNIKKMNGTLDIISYKK